MLPAAHRMRLKSDFEAAVRRGRRAGRRNLVVHAVICEGNGDAVARVGFVVSRAVGSAVVRNRVRRRLRAAMAVRAASLPRGALLVVRANPAAAGASSGVLTADLDAALPRVLTLRAAAAPTSSYGRPAAAAGPDGVVT